MFVLYIVRHEKYLYSSLSDKSIKRTTYLIVSKLKKA